MSEYVGFDGVIVSRDPDALEWDKLKGSERPHLYYLDKRLQVTVCLRNCSRYVMGYNADVVNIVPL